MQQLPIKKLAFSFFINQNEHKPGLTWLLSKQIFGFSFENVARKNENENENLNNFCGIFNSIV